MPLWPALRSTQLRFMALWWVAGLLAAAAPLVLADHKPMNVLVLYSNGRLLPANIEADRGLREGLAASTEQTVNVYDEFLDIPRFSGPAYLDGASTYLRQKYAAQAPDVIVAGGPEALAFCLEHRPGLFPGVPVVHMGVGKEFLGNLSSLPDDVVGAPISYDFVRTIDQARRWHPTASRLVLVTGADAQDHEWERWLREALPHFKAEWASVEFLAGLPHAAVLKRLGELPSDAVVFTTGYFQDGAGRRFSPREAAQALVRASTAPVYAAFNTFIGIGVVGGYMLDYRAIAHHAGTTANDVLHGSRLAAAGSAGLTPNALNLDWRQVRRWGIDEQAIPGDAVKHFKEPTLWEAHARELLIAAAVFLLQTGLIAGLFIERRRRQAAVQAERRLRMELLHASRVAMVGELTGAIAHEINQPLGAILSNAEAAEMMLASGAHEPGALRGILGDIRRDDLRASEVIRRLRALLSRHEVEHQRFDLNGAVADVEQILRADARRRGVGLEIRLAPTTAMMVGDRVQIQQVLINLVLNALEAVAGLPELQRRVSVSVEKNADRVTLVVQDRGAGITAEQMPRLFESFFSTKSTGMGLGLSIVRTLVEAHGGRVVAYNGVDGGAAFRVELPADGTNRTNEK